MRYVFGLLDNQPLEQIDAFMVQHGASPVLNVKATEPDYTTVDALLRQVDLERLNISCMLALLASTRSAQQHLAEYRPFFTQVRRHLLRTEDRSRVRRLLHGLRPRP